MAISDYTIFLPALGVIFHELLRFYQAIWNASVLKPLRRPGVYLLVVGLLALTVVVICFFAGIKDTTGRIAVGFSFTSGLGMLKPTTPTSEQLDDHFNDDAGSPDPEPQRKSRPLREFASWFYWY